MLRCTAVAPLLLGVLVACTTSDDSLTGAAAPALAAAPGDLVADSRIPPTIVWDDAGVQPRMIAGDFPVTGATDEAAARAFLANNGVRIDEASVQSLTADIFNETGLGGPREAFQQAFTAPAREG